MLVRRPRRPQLTRISHALPLWPLAGILSPPPEMASWRRRVFLRAPTSKNVPVWGAGGVSVNKEGECKGHACERAGRSGRLSVYGGVESSVPHGKTGRRGMGPSCLEYAINVEDQDADDIDSPFLGIL